ncbi:lactate racemase domain-containing protein [Selenomonas sp. TAMA-11512]|uniref:lactate racemase domain-containing protein n=1 Tax=Selenomonas sp. TAMA-11512 TaxID=3095337 RepID=UPI00308B91F3|nr:lactate racemase domain-containing protein [Selenomonas sp. TAMA-11512]
MKEIYLEAQKEIDYAEMEAAVDKLLQQFPGVKKVLIVPPDFTRCFSMAGELTQILYKRLHESAEVDIMPAVGTHAELSAEERKKMFGDIPADVFRHHQWQEDTVRIGEIPEEVVAKISEGLFSESIEIEVNRRFREGGYDLILSVGQVVPHEVVGMANYSKNIFVGLGGRQMINKSHMLSAICGIEQTLGVDHAPARQVFDYAQEHCLQDMPLVYLLTVTTADQAGTHLHGLFIGDSREPFDRAVALSQKRNITYLDRPAKKVVAYLDPFELKTTWVGNKGIYRSRMAIADGGELLLLAPGVHAFGENEEVDKAIRAYGYVGRDKILDYYNGNHFPNQYMVPAHLIQGSSDGRFSITYAVDPQKMSREEIEGVGFRYMDVAEAMRRYDPEVLQDGWQTMPDGEEIYFIRNPAIGLWRLP